MREVLTAHRVLELQAVDVAVVNFKAEGQRYDSVGHGDLAISGAIITSVERLTVKNLFNHDGRIVGQFLRIPEIETGYCLVLQVFLAHTRE